MEEVMTIKDLDAAWAKFHSAHKAMMSKTPGTAGHRKAEEGYGKAEEALNRVRMLIGLGS